MGSKVMAIKGWGGGGGFQRVRARMGGVFYKRCSISGSNLESQSKLPFEISCSRMITFQVKWSNSIYVFKLLIFLKNCERKTNFPFVS